jgi:hypothetical protein
MAHPPSLLQGFRLPDFLVCAGDIQFMNDSTIIDDVEAVEPVKQYETTPPVRTLEVDWSNSEFFEVWLRLARDRQPAKQG